ncbi:uncharacterized protein [Muntiacus reevesi]|uniref:uncharacterized protein isoform X2 n=1 Tax=Muntiacus reevesi TaxID=9886 RepID=UPI0033071BF1
MFSCPAANCMGWRVLKGLVTLLWVKAGVGSSLEECPVSVSIREENGCPTSQPAPWDGCRPTLTSVKGGQPGMLIQKEQFELTSHFPQRSIRPTRFLRHTQEVSASSIFNVLPFSLVPKKCIGLATVSPWRLSQED